MALYDGESVSTAKVCTEAIRLVYAVILKMSVLLLLLGGFTRIHLLPAWVPAVLREEQYCSENAVT